MYPDEATFIITRNGLKALNNNELPPSVFTSILKLADGVINYQTFKIFLKEHGDIHPLFAFLHNEGFIALSAEMVSNAEIDNKNVAILMAPKVPDDINNRLPNVPFDAIKLRQLGHDYISKHHPHMLVGAMAMLNSLNTKNDFLEHFDKYSRLIASDLIHSEAHIIEVLTYLA